jgi:hypothetical protein
MVDVKGNRTTLNTLASIFTVNFDDLEADRTLAHVRVLEATLFGQVRASAPDTTRVLCTVVSTAHVAAPRAWLNLITVMAEARITWRWYAHSTICADAIGRARVACAVVNVHAPKWRGFSVFTIRQALLRVLRCTRCTGKTIERIAIFARPLSKV